MATKTSLLGLTKPAYTDAADIAVLNGNFDLIDKAIVESAWNESLIDNSDFQIWQRGTTFEDTPVSQYHADRWRGSGNLLRSYTKVHNGCRVTAQNSATYMGITQMIPAEKLEPGRYTLVWEFTPSASCKTYNGTEAAAGVRTKEAVAVTVTSDNIAAGGRSAEAGIMCMADNSPISIGFYFDVHYVDFYKGAYTTDNAPLHHRRGYAAELAECMRYYQKGGQVVTVGTQYGTATKGIIRLRFCGMRSMPNITITGISSQGWGNIALEHLSKEWTSQVGTDCFQNYMIEGDSSFVGQTIGVEYEASADL